jgi:hypothetical protein
MRGCQVRQCPMQSRCETPHTRASWRWSHNEPRRSGPRGTAGAERADRTVAAWGRSRPAPRPRDEAYQRGYPSPQGCADRPLDKGHMVAHAAGGTFGPNMFAQDRELNRGWSVEGRRYRALEREIANTPGTFFSSLVPSVCRRHRLPGRHRAGGAPPRRAAGRAVPQPLRRLNATGWVEFSVARASAGWLARRHVRHPRGRQGSVSAAWAPANCYGHEGKGEEGNLVKSHDVV